MEKPYEDSKSNRNSPINDMEKPMIRDPIAYRGINSQELENQEKTHVQELGDDLGQYIPAEWIK